MSNQREQQRRLVEQIKRGFRNRNQSDFTTISLINQFKQRADTQGLNFWQALTEANVLGLNCGQAGMVNKHLLAFGRCADPNVWHRVGSNGMYALSQIESEDEFRAVVHSVRRSRRSQINTRELEEIIGNHAPRFARRRRTKNTEKTDRRRAREQALMTLANAVLDLGGDLEEILGQRTLRLIDIEVVDI